MNIKAMTMGIFLSLAFTALVVAIVFKSAKLGVVALFSTVLPVLAGFGIWGWISGDIGLAATAVIALTIGVVVDDSAHFIYRFLDGRNRLELEAWQAAIDRLHLIPSQTLAGELARTHITAANRDLQQARRSLNGN